MLALLVLVPVIVGRVDNGPWTDAPTEGRIDQTVELAVVIVDGKTVRAPDSIQSVKLAGRKRATKPLEGARVQWSIIEPHGFRTVKPAVNGTTADFYSNVSLEPKTFGKWLGYDSIEYFERVVHAWRDEKPITAVIATADPKAQQVPGLGTLRYKAEVELDGQTLATPGTEAADAFGLLPNVHRVSIRQDDSFLGFLSSYLLVPEVLGSAGGGKNHQTERFTGADCADVMVGAMRRKGARLAYTNVAGLPAYAKTIAAAIEIDERGMPTTEIAGVKPGDLIRIDYGGQLRGHTPRAFDHVAALWEDKSDPDGPSKGAADGKLDGFDLVIHMGHPRLLIEPLSGQSPATIDVLRWKN
ncbi:MAG: hypothetical protein M4D80_12065 [Myxococcota bacterium]|nr:hypothetical protein [Deltaproteobacteria bacterium]MDQ3335895.1 hypothetical protein [Myxococcota bacterium]